MRKLAKGMLAVAVGVVAIQPSFGSEGDPFDQPRVTAWGRFNDGGFLICRGMDCAGVRSGFTERAPLEDQLTLTAETGIDRDQFCAALKSKRPSNCDASNPPSTPGLDSNWQPNGCGTSGTSNLFLDSGLELLFSDNYSGDFQAPYGGVSFRSACDAHDACWGVGGSRSTCDDNFHAAMISACGSVTPASSQTVCRGFAGLYFGAVSTTDIANNNYTNAVAARRCALWAHDFKANGCE